MQQHLIFIDIDGTLIHDDQTVSQYTKDTLARLQAAGHIVYIATGRMKPLAELVRAQLNPQIKLINSNGAMYELATKQYYHFLERPALADVVETVEQYQAPVRLFTKDQVYHNLDNLDNLNALSFLAKSLVKDSFHHFKNAAELDNRGIVNGLVAGVPIPTIKKIRLELASSPNLVVSSSSMENVELLPLDVSKASAVNAVQKFYKIPKERTIVFGNGENDIPMLEAAQVSVAMANSEKIVFDHASYQTLTNEADGVAVFLNEYFK